MKSIYTKLFEAQKKIEAIAKTEKNPFFKSNYFDINTLIAEVKPTLNEVGLVIIQPLSEVGGKPALTTIIADPETGESISETTVLPDNPDPQKMGAIITYFRRYALQSLLFLQAVDDDGNTAAGHAPARTYQPKPPVEPEYAPPFEDYESAPGTKKCPKCGILHAGKFPKCLDCWKKEQPPKA